MINTRTPTKEKTIKEKAEKDSSKDGEKNYIKVLYSESGKRERVLKALKPLKWFYRFLRKD